MAEKKLKIKLYDTNFEHLPSGSSASSFPGYNFLPKYIEWIREPFECDFAFFTDNCLKNVGFRPHKYNFALILEPRSLIPNVYELISNPENYKKFTKVLTHDEELLELDSDIFVYSPLGGCWIKPEDQKIYPKTKNVCMIMSYKRELIGHKFRWEILNSGLIQKHGIDVFGNGTNRPFNQMVDVLKDYETVIVVENTPGFVTEKVISPMRCGSQVLYWKGNSKFTNESKIINFNTIEELDHILMDVEHTYKDDLEWGYIKHNFEYSKQFTVCEDWIFENILKDYI